MKKLLLVVSHCLAVMSVGSVFADSGESWTFTFNTATNPNENRYGTLESGNWKLKAMTSAAGSTDIWLSDNAWPSGAAAYIEGSGVLDLSLPIYCGTQKMRLTKVLRAAFQNMNVSVTRLVLPETINEIATYAFANASKIDKIYCHSTLVTALPERAFQSVANMKVFDVAFPSLPSSAIGNQALNVGATDTIIFDASGWGAIGSYGLFNRNAVRHLALKTAAGQAIAVGAFRNDAVKVVSLLGDKPDLSARGTAANADPIFGGYVNAGLMLFRVPFGNATYDDWRAQARNSPLNATELTNFRNNFPGEPDPIGWVNASLVGTHKNQILADFNPLALENTLVVSATEEYAEHVPGCRSYVGLSDQETLELSVPDFVSEGVKYGVTGYELKRPKADGEGWSVEAGSESSLTFVQKGMEGARLTWQVGPVGYASPVVTDYSPYTETVMAVADKAPDADGFYPVGTTWTLTPAGMKTEIPKSRFVRWVGDVPAGHEQDNPLVVQVSEAANIRAEFVRDWCYLTYDAGNDIKCISDGVWTLRVLEKNHQLSLGDASWTAGNGILAGPAEATPLAIEGDITDASDSTYNLTTVNDEVFHKVPTISSFKLVSDTLTTVKTRMLSEMPNLRELCLDLPNCTSVSKNFADVCPNLTKVTLKCPMLVTLPEQCFRQSPLNASDFSRWDLSGLETISSEAFFQSHIDENLKFPKLRTIGQQAFRQSTLVSASFGTKFLSAINANAFKYCENFKTLTLGNAQDLVVDSTAFYASDWAATSRLTSLTFLGAAPAKEQIDNIILPVVATTGAKNCRIYASANKSRRSAGDNWTDLAAEPTGDEIAAAATERAKQLEAGLDLLGGGVYRDGNRKAWLIAKPSPYDDRGACLILR